MDLQVYGQIMVKVKSILGIDLTNYKDEQMRRRLDSWLVRVGFSDWDTYFQQIRQDNQELARFRDYLTINVSEFFRDADRWQTMRDKVLPDLLKEAAVTPGKRGLRIWSAGCSVGPEPYTLSIILDELARGHQSTILATDLDRGALKKAQAGGPYSADDIRNVSAAERQTYFKAGGPPFYVNPQLSSRITFREHNLFQDPFENNFDLIVCRNVIIYFTTEAKNLLYHKFADALRPGGILFLGGTEIIPRPQDYGLTSYGISLYRKNQ